VRKAAGRAIRLHDLRHSFTTVARGLGYGDHVIAHLVDHAVHGGVTPRCGDVPDVLVERAANDVSGAIAGMLEPVEGRVLTFPGPRR
jgi:hypothetical protein